MYVQPSILGSGAISVRLWTRWLSDADTRRRFEVKVHRRAAPVCWYWTGAIGSDGHGRFRAGSRSNGTSRVVTAHVYAYQLAYGLCPERLLHAGFVIRHRCDEASCQNPLHLQVGTAADNVTDYQVRRWRQCGPLGDGRGAAGRARAIRAAIVLAGAGDTETVIAAAAAAGHPADHQLTLTGL